MYQFLTALIYSTLILMPAAAFAAPSYTVAPLVISETLEARDIYNKEIVVTNTGTQPVTVYPTVNNISLSAGGTIEEFTQRVNSDATASLSAWIEVSRRGVDISPGESKGVLVTIRMHPNVQPGEYHAFIGFGYGRVQSDAEAMVKAGNAPGTIVTVTVGDTRVESLRLGSFLIDRFVTNTEDAAVHYTLTNPGETVVVPTGDIIYYNSRGEEVGSAQVNPERLPVAPGEEVVVSTNPTLSGFIGKYKGYLTVQYGTAQLASVQDTVFFYYVPMHILLILLGALLVLTVIVAVYVHRRYLVDMGDDADYLHLHVRDTVSDEVHHDIDLKKKDDSQA